MSLVEGEPGEIDIARDQTVESNGILESMIHSYGVSAQPVDTTGGGLLVGEIIDSHHPHMAGRVLVRWLGGKGETHEHWLTYPAHVRGDIGIRVLLTRPLNWSEWVVVSALSASSPMKPKKEEKPHQTQTSADAESNKCIQLEAGELLHVESTDGTPLFELLHRDKGAVLRIGRDLKLELEGTFRVEADRIEMCSGQGGTDSRSDGEMVCRSPRIRLN